mmetsp:Transcript_4059/g.7849  ORF Transcript_4059/g.7849 Transcript_4059/m.7849 type:complete len:147 (+) Transcript_4059:634-1074(+)
MTIDLLRVNLDGCFAPGQAYVACSRGRSAELMMVERFSEDKIITSDIVKQFYSSLKSKIEFRPPTWAVILENAKKEPEIKERMVAKYGGEKCWKCQSVCTVYQVKSRGKNHRKWVVQCKASHEKFMSERVSEFGHAYRYVPGPPVA